MSRDIALYVRGLTMEYVVREGTIKAVDKIDLDFYRHRVTAIVGESGSGKTSLIETILRILPRNARIRGGSAVLVTSRGEEIDLVRAGEEVLRRIRGRVVGYVPQGSQNSLNPVLTVEQHFIETLRSHGVRDTETIRKVAYEKLELVRIDPGAVLKKYPHELSGGMKQRVVIALTMSLDPEIVVLDEPTSALDIFSQRVLLNILDDIRERLRTTMILITHDLPVAAELADMVAVLYAGKVVEYGPVEEVFNRPGHPYTQLLIKSIPSILSFYTRSIPRPIPGEPPSLLSPPPGCRFHPRCPYAMDICRREDPPAVETGRGHYVKCWLYLKR